MPVNLAQYRLTVGIFNNCQIIVDLCYEVSSYSDMSNDLPNYGFSFSSLIFYFFFCFLFQSKCNALKITKKLRVPFFLFPNNVACVLVSRCSLLLILGGNVETNPGLLSNCEEWFSICYWNPNSISALDYSNFFFWKHILYFLNLTSFAYQKHILILLLPLMMKNYKFLGRLWFVFIIPIIQNTMDSVYIIEVLYRIYIYILVITRISDLWTSNWQ